MFSFIHGYDEKYWEAMLEKGFIDETSGLRIVQCFAVDEDKKFNTLAAKGGKLYNIVKEGKLPLYVDRLQGGVYYNRYDFDACLMEHYSEITGGKFLGVQMHEWARVRNMDWERIKGQLKTIEPPWTEKQIYEAIYEVSAYKKCIHLSCGTPLEYSRCKYPASISEYIQDCREHFELRQKENHGFVLPTDAGILATKIELELGAKALMVEIGDQTSYARIQTSLVRAMAKMYNVPWGCYYEPWGGKEFSTCFYRTDKEENEWCLGNEVTPFSMMQYGSEGGSSRALQKRLFYYSYMCGADYLCEEWGVCNTFTNWNTFDISPYGQIKKDFIDFTRTYSDRGRLFTPVALILPKELEILDIMYLRDDVSAYYNGYLNKGFEDRADFYNHIKNVLLEIFGSKTMPSGNETHCLTDSGFGDYFDIIYDDADEGTLSQYEYLIDLNYDSRFYQENEKKYNVIESKDFSKLVRSLREIENKFPCSVEGNILWNLNICDDGIILSLFNNNGVHKSAQKGELFDHYADQIAIANINVNYQNVSVLTDNDDIDIERFNEHKYRIKVKAGGLCILKFH